MTKSPFGLALVGEFRLALLSMFTGHYAPAMLAKTHFPQAPLWQLFFAAQAIDILFFIFVPLGIEQLKLDPSRPALLSLQIGQMHWSHSLVATVAYASLFIVWGVWAKKRAVAIALALTTLSHWFLDALVHTPDVPVAPGLDWKVGLRLWEHGWIASAVEIGLLGLCGAFLWRKWSGQTRAPWLLGFLALLMIVQTLNDFVVPLPPTVPQLALVSQVSFFGFAALAYLVESRPSTTRSAREL